MIVLLASDRSKLRKLCFFYKMKYIQVGYSFYLSRRNMLHRLTLQRNQRRLVLRAVQFLTIVSLLQHSMAEPPALAAHNSSIETRTYNPSETLVQAPAGYLIQASDSITATVADTPWPMYQHDPQHTGRSPFLGPTHRPRLLWVAQLPQCSGGNGGITVAQDGSLLLSLGGCLHNFDPVSRKLKWTYGGDISRSLALVDNNNDFYWGYGIFFARISPSGIAEWIAQLDLNYVFGSSSTFGPDGNLYFVHDGLWSFTSDGQFRWYNPYGYVGTHASPAIAPDGTIYARGDFPVGLVAYQPNGVITWTVDLPNFTYDESPAVGADGTIYITSQEGILDAITPNGQLKWSYDPGDYPNGSGSSGVDGLALPADGSIYYAISTMSEAIPTNTLYAVDSGGHLKWKVPFLPNSLTQLEARFFYPIVTDRAGHIFVCNDNSNCYGIGPDGSILWQFEFPLVDSITVVGASQVLLVDDGLLYIVDYQSRLYAYADPQLYPGLTTPVSDVSQKVEPGAQAFTVSVPISSTLAPITYTATISPSDWLTVSQFIGVTPGSITLNITPTQLDSDVYHANLLVKPLDQSGDWLNIPVLLNVGQKQLFLPLMVQNYQRPYQIVYLSNWFEHLQLASIEQTGRKRTIIANDLPTQIDEMVYSPDGSKVAMRHYLNNKHQITVLDTTNGQTLLDMHDLGWYFSPAWSPDSQRLAFVVRENGVSGPVNQIYVINLDGSGLVRLTNDSTEKSNLHWSPNGDKIAYHKNANTYIMNPDGSGSYSLFSGRFIDLPVDWSPDGRYLLTESVVDSMKPPELWMYDFQTGVYNKLAESIAYDNPAVWSPDGKQIAYVYMKDSMSHIAVMNADGSGVINLAYNPDREDTQPVWSPDSYWIAFTSRGATTYEDPNFDLFVIRADGSDLRLITLNIGSDINPGWLPWK